MSAIRGGILGAVALIVCLPGWVWAGGNSQGKLAMHVVASGDSLDWEDLVPAACESIHVDVSAAEIFEAGGHGYVVLLAYSVDAVSGVEFALSGWPAGRGAPVLNDPVWHEAGATTFGDHLAAGGATGLGACANPGTAGLVPLGYLRFGPVDSTDVPITLEFTPSTYTDAQDSLLAFTDCSEDFVVAPVVLATGCTIGGVHGEEPDCTVEPDEGGGDISDGNQYDWPVVVETGTLYAYGHKLEAPYVFVFKNDSLYVNEIPVLPALSRESPRPRGAVPELARRQFELAKRVSELIQEMTDRGEPLESIVARAAEAYAESPLIESVRVQGPDIILRWANDPHPDGLTVETRPRAPLPTREEICHRRVMQFASALRPRKIVFYGHRYFVSMDRARARVALDLLRESADPVSEDLSLLRGNAAKDLIDPLALDLH